MIKTVLVTGGCGFIGANFIRLALKNKPQWQIINLDKLTYAGNLKSLADCSDHPRYTFIKGDINDSALVDQLFKVHQVDMVVHFAAESHVDRSISGPAEFIETNINGTFSLLESARMAWAPNHEKNLDNRFLHVSTDEVYGSLGATGLFSETTPYDPRSPYSSSKAASDHLVRAYYHTYHLPILLTNCSNNYGPYQFPEKLIPLVLKNGLIGEPLPVYGKGANIRDWLYVVDHCEAIMQVLEKGRVGESYNIGSNNERRNLEVVEILCDLLDEKVGLLPTGRPRRELITFVTDRLGHDMRYGIDASKICNELGWQPQLSFQTGMALTVDWYLANQDWVNAVTDGSYRQYYQEMYGQPEAKA